MVAPQSRDKSRDPVSHHRRMRPGHRDHEGTGVDATESQHGIVRDVRCECTAQHVQPAPELIREVPLPGCMLIDDETLSRSGELDQIIEIGELRPFLRVTIDALDFKTVIWIDKDEVGRVEPFIDTFQPIAAMFRTPCRWKDTLLQNRRMNKRSLENHITFYTLRIIKSLLNLTTYLRFPLHF